MSGGYGCWHIRLMLNSRLHVQQNRRLFCSGKDGRNRLEKEKMQFFPGREAGKKRTFHFAKWKNTFRWTEISVTTESNFRYCGGKIPLLRRQNSVSAEANFRYYGVKFPLVRKNDSFARPGPLPPVTVVPQRVAPIPVPRREIFPKKNSPPACGSGESSYLCTRFPEGGRARRRPRRSGKKSSGLREKSLAVPEETLTFAARFPLERGSPGRDGSSGPGGEKSDL